jgi:hypothetical protein
MTTYHVQSKICIGNSQNLNGHDASMPSLLEHLETNAKWWGEAALACRNRAAQFPSFERESLEWQLQAAVYDERTGINARFIERLRERSCSDADTFGAVPVARGSVPVDRPCVKNTGETFLT